MARGCGCAGESCGCSVVAGTSIAITGVGSKANPFRVSVDLAKFPLTDQVKVADSTTVDMTISGTGTPADPLILSAAVLLVAPNGAKYTLAVDNNGVLSAKSV